MIKPPLKNSRARYPPNYPISGETIQFLSLIFFFCFAIVTQGQKPVTPQEGEELAKKLKALKFIECSAYTGTIFFSFFILIVGTWKLIVIFVVVVVCVAGDNLKMVFDEAVKAVLFAKKKKAKGGCKLF